MASLIDSIGENYISGNRHAGNWLMNCRAVGIEVVSAGEDFNATEIQKLAWLVRKLMAKYGIGSSGVIRHYDVTGKLCPAPYVAASKWAALKARITGGAAIPSGSEASAPSGTVAELARRVIAGEFGNGDARRAALGSRYDEVQAEVNRILAGGCPYSFVNGVVPDFSTFSGPSKDSVSGFSTLAIGSTYGTLSRMTA